MNFIRTIAVTLIITFGANAQIASPAGAAPAPAAQPMDAQLNEALLQLEQTAQNSALELARMRIEKWKADSSVKREAQQNSEALQRNLTAAMPQLVSAVRSRPGDISAAFKLYRNLNVVYEYFAQLAESAGAFGPKDQYTPLAQQAANMDGVRRTLADRLETMTTQVSGELQRLREQVRLAQVATPAAVPKRIVIDDNEPAKKSPRKKPVPKPPAKQPTSASPGGD